MFDRIIAGLTKAIGACLDWFEQIFDAVSGVTGLYLAFFAIGLTWRFLLLPLLRGGTGSSDKAKKGRQSGAGASKEE